MANKGVALSETAQLPPVPSAKPDPIFRGELEEIDDGWDAAIECGN